MDRLLPRLSEGPGGCWLWPGATNGVGYGVINVDGERRSMRYVHRLTYEYFRAEIPAGLVIDHLCRVTLCCNPWHLEPVTLRENFRRGEQPDPKRYGAFQAAKTHCPYGHPYDRDNTAWTAKGSRQCKRCKYLKSKAWAEANRDLVNQRARDKRGYAGPIAACRRAGHPYDEANTYINHLGKRVCRQCRRDREQTKREALA